MNAILREGMFREKSTNALSHLGLPSPDLSFMGVMALNGTEEIVLRPVGVESHDVYITIEGFTEMLRLLLPVLNDEELGRISETLREADPLLSEEYDKAIETLANTLTSVASSVPASQPSELVNALTELNLGDIAAMILMLDEFQEARMEDQTSKLRKKLVLIQYLLKSQDE